VFKESKGQKVLKDQKACRESRAFKASKEFKENRDQLESRVCRESKENKVFRVKMVQMLFGILQERGQMELTMLQEM
jgi:hypothetical protein